MVKCIKVPSAVKVELPGQEPKKYPFVDFVLDLIITSPQFGKGYEMARKGEKLKSIILGVKPNQFLKLDSEDYDVLMECTKTGQLAPIFNMAALPFYEAIKDATQAAEGKTKDNG